jgi:hypothetical protein
VGHLSASGHPPVGTLQESTLRSQVKKTAITFKSEKGVLILIKERIKIVLSKENIITEKVLSGEVLMTVFRKSVMKIR